LEFNQKKNLKKLKRKRVNNFEKEIEIKFKIDEKIVSRLKNLKLESYEEIDEYFFASKEIIDKRIFLRLRTKKGKIFLNLKVITKGGKVVDIYEADEIETEISKKQYEKIKEIFNIVFPIHMQVKKKRSVGMLNDCELFYDKVDNLGDFLEIEGPREKIFEICESFNIDIEKQKDREEGYAIMTLKKMGLI
jgi:adenylate cyclase class IV